MGEVRTLVGQGADTTAPPGQGVVQHAPLLLTTKEAQKTNTTAWHAKTRESMTKYATKYVVSENATLEASTKVEAGGGVPQC